MADSYWEDAVYSTPPLRDLDRSDTSVTFDWLARHFPADGAKIDWRQVRGKHAHWRTEDPMQLASIARREIRQRIRPGTTVEHAGDGLSPYGVRFTDDNASSVVTALLAIPEHHYFVAADRSWLVVVTAEGDLDTVEQIGKPDANRNR